MDIITLAMAKAYTDTQRLGYAETQKVIFLPHGVYEFTYDDGMNMAQVPYENGDLIESFVGKELVVEFDGTMYKCQLKAIGVTQGVGNLAVASFGGDTGEPFLILLTLDGYAAIVVYGNATTHTISVHYETETIHPIDPKYLPGVCLPVITLSTIAVEEDVVCTAEESAAFTAAAKTKLPVFVQAHVAQDDVQADITGILYYGNETVGEYNVDTYTGYLNFMSASITKIAVTQGNDGWTFRIEDI